MFNDVKWGTLIYRFHFPHITAYSGESLNGTLQISQGQQLAHLQACMSTLIYGERLATNSQTSQRDLVRSVISGLSDFSINKFMNFDHKSVEKFCEYICGSQKLNLIALTNFSWRTTVTLIFVVLKQTF